MDYASLQTKAADLIANYGQAVTLTPHSSGSYDVGTSGVTLTETPTVSTTGVLLPLSQGVRGFRYGISDQPGTNILSSDQTLLLPGDITTPEVNAKATINGVDYTVIAVSPLNPGGVNLIYECVVRGAA